LVSLTVTNLDLNQINQDFIDQNDLIHKNNNSSTQSEDIQTESQLGILAMTVTDKYYAMTTQFDSNDGLKKISFKCATCDKIYMYKKCFDKHECKVKKFQIKKSFKTSIQNNLCEVLPFFSEEKIDIDYEYGYIKVNHMDHFNKLNSNDFQILHININSLFNNKIYEIDEILKTKQFDMLLINETRLDENVPNSFYSNINYSILRRDRLDNGGGGVMVFIKKQYNILEVKINEIEAIALKIKFNNIFIEKLENALLNFDPNDSTFIIGDLNMNLAKNETNEELTKFMDDFDYNNHVTEFTRVAKKFFKKKNKYITSKTIIDVVLHNRDLVQSTKVVNCPYSDQKFVVTKIKLPKNTNNAQ